MLQVYVHGGRESMDWFPDDNSLRHERVNKVAGF